MRSATRPKRTGCRLDKLPEAFERGTDLQASWQVFGFLHVRDEQVNLFLDSGSSRVVRVRFGFTLDCEGAGFDVALAILGFLACDTRDAGGCGAAGHVWRGGARDWRGESCEISHAANLREDCEKVKCCVARRANAEVSHAGPVTPGLG